MLWNYQERGKRSKKLTDGDSSKSPFLFEEHVYKWLDSALDMGLTEYDFWNMTIGEFDRYVESQRRLKEQELREKAFFDWTLGDLIGRSISRIYSAQSHYPEIYEAYPSIYKKEDIEQKRQEERDRLSALRLQEFADAFKKRKEEVAKKNE